MRSIASQVEGDKMMKLTFQAFEGLYTCLQITEKDEEVLEYLVDIRSQELSGEDECGFEITFEFAENPFFENSTLVPPPPYPQTPSPFPP